MRKYLIFAGLLFLAGCGAAPYKISDRQDYLAEATRVYAGETKERVLQAAETILKTSDPANIDMRYTGNGFTALRRYFIYAVLAAARGQEKWEFNVEERPNAVEASLSVSDQGESVGGYTRTRYEGAMNSIPLYRLFWKRMDYMLGKRPDWVSCNEESKVLEAQGTNVAAALSGLCGGTSAGRDAVAEPLPPRPVTAGQKNAAARASARSKVMNN